MNPHWDAFARDLFWFVSERKRVDVGPLLPPGSWRPSGAVSSLFPTLARLLSGAHTSSIAIDEDEYVLFSWPSTAGVLSWLARPPDRSAPGTLLPAHRTLVGEFGGVAERGGEFEEQWLLNTNDSLTVEEASHDAGFIHHYAWAFESTGGIPIETAAYYSISREANGNDTLCHRVTGEVLLFAPDHSFGHIVPLEGCPEFTLYRIPGAASFVEWVEAVARQWTEAWEKGRPTMPSS